LSSSWAATAFATNNGAEWVHGELVAWHYDLTTARVAVAFRGHQNSFDLMAVSSHAEFRAAVVQWVEEIQTKKGLSNGVPGQASQAIPSNSTQPLTVTVIGSGGGGAGGGQLTANQQYKQMQAYMQQAYLGAAGQQQYNNLAQQGLGNIAQQHQLRAGPGINQTNGAEPHLPPLKTEGIRLGEIIAWRGWRLTSSGFLKSMSADVIWPPGEPMEGKTKSSEEHNGCYAYKTARDFLKNHEGSGLDVYGKVALWGDVIEHELGYRAQFAKVVSIEHFLKAPAPHKLFIKDLREKYGCVAA